MKILIIGGTSKEVDESVRSYYQEYVEFFQKSASVAGQDVSIETCLLDDLIISVGDGVFSIFDTRNNQPLDAYSAYFLRGDGFRHCIDVIATVNEFAHANNIHIINDYSNVRDSSKLLQAVSFYKIGASVARTLYVNAALIAHSDTVEWRFPCIMKASHGSHGNDNYVVSSWDDVRERQLAQPEKRFVLQRFVPNNGDYRILIIGDNLLVIGRHAVGDSHLNNTSQGGEAVLIDPSTLPEGLIADAKKIMSNLGLTIAGVDALVDNDTNEYSFLEVNAQPQLMTGAFLDEKKALVGALIESLAQ